ncbi:MAG: MATE family efflux transporter, partial [Lachnospiraceae bacterium]|nr:MATE family efflux transporter [Lachnospiraceae bacterium]
FNLTIFGAVSGPSIFGAQFFGKGDAEGQKHTFRFRLLLCIGIIAAALAIFSMLDTQLISLYLSKDDAPDAIAATLSYGKTYMSIMLWGLIPFGIGQAYSSVVRECGETRIQMIASVIAVMLNLFLDYSLIFGKFGLPKMGVSGAALATVFAKSIEALIVILWVHLHPEKNRYIIGAFKGFYIPRKLAGDMMRKGFLLLVNEFMWSVGMSVIAQCYSIRGLNVVAARNIAGTMINLFNVIYIQLGSCIAIMVGAKLGAQKLEEAKDLDNKLLFFCVASTFVVTLCMLPIAHIFPNLYNTEMPIKRLATYFITIQALAMPLWSYTHACYFTLRSGGKTGLTFLFDFGYTWAVMIPLAFVLSYFTGLNIHIIFAITTFSEIIKVFIGYYFVRSNVWLNNIVSGNDHDA